MASIRTFVRVRGTGPGSPFPVCASQRLVHRVGTDLGEVTFTALALVGLIGDGEVVDDRRDLGLFGTDPLSIPFVVLLRRNVGTTNGTDFTDAGVALGIGIGIDIAPGQGIFLVGSRDVDGDRIRSGQLRVSVPSAMYTS